MTQSGLTAAPPTRTKAGKAANIALWVLQILLALAFGGAASGKLLGKGQWFRYVTGLSRLGTVTS